MHGVIAVVTATVFCSSLTGCANFSNIKAFAKDGSTVAAAAKKDAEAFSVSCSDLKAEIAVLEYAGGASSVTQKQSLTCASVSHATTVTAESLSVQLMVSYHEALNSLAGDENWTLSKEIEALGGEVKKIKIDEKSISSEADVVKYQAAFTAITDLIVSALREREARRLLAQPLNWNEVLKPLRFWYEGKDGTSFYVEACRIIRTEWKIVQSQWLEYARCEKRSASGVPVCEPLTAGSRLASIDEKIKPLNACAPSTSNVLPDAAAARVKSIDEWIAANEELRRNAFEKNPEKLLEKLASLRVQVGLIKKAFD